MQSSTCFQLVACLRAQLENVISDDRHLPDVELIVVPVDVLAVVPVVDVADVVDAGVVVEDVGPVKHSCDAELQSLLLSAIVK